MRIAHLARVAFCASLFLTAAACGPTGVTPGTDAGVDLRAAPPDLAVRLDFTVPPDLTEPEDLTPPPDLANPCSIVGDWELEPGFVMTLDAKGQLLLAGMVVGAYTFKGRTFTITDVSTADCMMPGTYTLAFSQDCRTVTATLVSDPCTDRAKAITMQPWTRK